MPPSRHEAYSHQTKSHPDLGITCAPPTLNVAVPSFLPYVLGLAAALSLSAPAYAEKPTMFPFVMPWDDATPTAIDASDINPAPITESSRIVVKDGRFHDGTGRRVRFLGVNFAFGANFPEKTVAEKVARRLRKLGVNIVRLHHMDTRRAPQGIVSAHHKDTQHLDPDQLDRLDYLVAELKKNGIYVFVDLKVGRVFNEADGVLDPSLQPGKGKVASWFDPRFIQLQKDYARDLLTRVNPYTGLSYARDPVVALVSIINEDTLVGSAGTKINELHTSYRDQLTAGWNHYLKEKYGTAEKMLAAWNVGAKPLGENLLPALREPLGWKTKNSAGAEVIVSVVPLDHSPLLRLEVARGSASYWVSRLRSPGLELQNGQIYTLSFRARASGTRTLSIGLNAHRSDDSLATPRPVKVGSEWHDYSLVFRVENEQARQGAVEIELRNKTPRGTLDFADISLRQGFRFSLPEGESLENLSISLPDNVAHSQGEDYLNFLSLLERRYIDAMRSYLVNEVGLLAPLTGSQASYGGILGAFRESSMNFADMHAYWQHPTYPNRTAQDTGKKAINSFIANTPMVLSQGGLFGKLSAYRLEGQPFTVTEFNEPAPNDFSAEIMPMMASFAAFQDWDGIFLFQYNKGDLWEADFIKGSFDSDSHPGKMAFFPAAARIFLYDPTLRTAAPRQVLEMPKPLVPALAERFEATGAVWASLGAPPHNYLQSVVSLAFPSESSLRILTEPAPPEASLSMRWAHEDDAGFYVATAPAWAVVVSYNREPRAVSAGGFTISPRSPDRPFGAYTLVSRDGRPVAESAALLLTAAGLVENKGMEWNDERTNASNWGGGPVLAEGLCADISIATDAKQASVFALDPTGARRGEVPSSLNSGKLAFRIDPEHTSLFYEIALVQSPDQTPETKTNLK